MANITIDGQNYDFDSMSTDAKAQLSSIQFVDAELQRLNAKTAVLQTARNAYLNTLKQHLGAPVLAGENPLMKLQGDTIRLQ